MNRKRATLIGFVAASAIPAALLAILSPLSKPLNIYSIMGFVVFYPYSAAATALLGVPTFLLFRRFSLVNIWSALLGGFCDGVLVDIVISLPNPPDVRSALMFGAMAALAAFVFWSIWRRGRDPVA